MTAQPQDIAIVGMACRFPGANDYQAYWNLLVNNRHAIREIPPDRWDIEKYYSSDFEAEGKSISKWGGLIDHLEAFDCRYFQITPREAANMDAQQRLLLQEAARCIEDAGLPLAELQQAVTSVYVGVMAVDHYANTVEAGQLNAYSCLGSYGCILSNRISNYFGFTGESITVDTACSSSLVALHHARKALLSGECDYALVGGVSTIQHPFRYISFSKARMLSPDGRCKTFDSAANGYVPGEGAGLILLQRANEAKQQRKHIHAIVKGTAANHTGKGSSITAPKVSAQQAVVESAIQEAGIDANRISYIEAHGTGTSLGDPIEVEALTQAFRSCTNGKREGPCQIGSVKSNIGHLEAAAGIAGIIKVVLMMREKTIVKTLHIQQLNPIIDFTHSPFRPALENTSWNPAADTLVAGVSSFGFGGVNAHTILENAPAIVNSREENEATATGLPPLLLSAQTPEALQDLCRQWQNVLTHAPADALPQLLISAAVGRTPLACRKAFHEPRAASLIQRLSEAAEEKMIVPKPLQESILIFSAGFGSAGLWPWVLKWIRTQAQLQPLLAQEGIALQSLPETPDNNNPSVRLVQMLANWSWVQQMLLALPETKVLGGDTLGIFCSWAHSVGLTEQETLQLFKQNLSIPPAHLPLRRYNLWLAGEGRLIPPVLCDERFFTAIANSTISGEQQAFILAKSRQLWENQFTFKKFVQEWAPLVNAEWETDTLAILESRQSPGDEKAARAITVFLAYSLKRLYVKWNLQHVVRLGNDDLEMLLYLLVNRQLEIKQVIALLAGRNGKMKEVALNGFADSFAGIGNIAAYQHPFLPVLMPAVEEPATGLYLPEEGNYICIHNPDAPVSGNHNTLAAGNPDMLAPLWEKGVNVNWRQAIGRTYRPLSVPVFYPFIIPAGATKIEPAAPAAAMPAILQVDAETYQRTFIPANEPVIAAHIICRQNLLPAASQIEFALQVAERTNRQNKCPGYLQFLNPGLLNGETGITCRQTTDGFTLLQNEVQIAKGRWLAGETITMAPPPDERVAISSATGTELYTFLQRSGFHYAPALQVVSRLNEYAEHFSFDLEIPPAVSDSGGALTALTDGAFHCMLWAASRWQNLLQTGENLLVPFMLGRVNINETHFSGNYTVCIEKKSLQFNGAQFRAGISVWKNTQCVLALTDVIFQQVSANFIHDFSRANPSPVQSYRLAVPAWQPIALQPGTASLPQTALVSAIPVTLPANVSVALQLSYNEDWLPVLQAWMNARADQPLLLRLWLAPLENEQAVELVYKLAEQCLVLLQTVLKRKSQHNVVVQLLLNNSISCAAGEPAPAFAHAALEGMARCLLQETRHTFLQLIDTDKTTITECWKAADAAWQNNGYREPVVCFRNNEPFVRKLVQMPEAGGKETIPHNSDVVLIVGGAGGAGWQTAIHLRARSAAQLIIVGRKPFTALAEDKQQAIKNNRFIYEQCDTARESDVRALFERLQTGGMNITIFIHAAGVLEDKFIITKDIAGFRRVLDAKVRSIVLLRRHLATHPLRKCIVYASAVTFSGNIGQADYAVANAFLNAWCSEMNRVDKTVSYSAINWTVLENTGMARGHLATELLNKTGLQPVTMPAALQAFTQVWAQNTAVCYVLNPQSPLITAPVTGKLPEAPPEPKKTAGETNSLFPTMKQNIAAIIELNAAEIDEHTDLRHYGVDSVLISRIVEMLGRLFDETHVYPSLLMEYPTIAALQGYFAGLVQAAIPETPASTSGIDNETGYTPAAAKPAGKATASLIKNIIAGVIQINAAEIDDAADLRGYGIDSVTISSITDKLGWQFGAENVYPSLMMEYTSVEALAAYFAPLPGNKATTNTAETTEPAKPAAEPFRSAQQKTTATRQAILSIVAKELGWAETDLDELADLREYGIDSVAIGAITQKMAKLYGDCIYPSLLIEYPTIISLVQYINTANPGGVVEMPPAEASSTPVPFAIEKEERHIPVQPEIKQAAITTDRNTADNPIAIIGLHCRFPGSPNPEIFWENLCAGKDCIGPVPAERWDVQSYFDTGRVMNKSYVARGGFISGVDLFDNQFFGISDEEALNMDPQQRLFLELTQELLDRSGYTRNEIQHSPVGIFIGANESNYGRRLPGRNKFHGKQGVVNTVSNLIAGRIADFYDLTGPAQVVYTACSSSLVALHNACLSIRNGDCHMAIAGGIELLLDEEWFIGFSNAQALSPDACSRVFDKGANGFVLAEGMGAVLLKPLKQAMADGDQIAGIINTSAINNDGSTMGLTTPNLKAQKNLIRKALQQSGIHPSTITLYEAHGTGTSLGDPTEIKAATEVFREYTSETQWCALGSVKSNIGHTLSAAGMAGLLKILLAFRHRMLPATIHCNEPHPRFQFSESPFFPNTALQPWRTHADTRRGAVSSFGFGGTNVHFIVEEFDPVQKNYRPLRKPLTPTVFNRKSFWLSASPQADTEKLKELLTQLSLKQTTVQQAKKELLNLKLMNRI